MSAMELHFVQHLQRWGYHLELRIRELIFKENLVNIRQAVKIFANVWSSSNNKILKSAYYYITLFHINVWCYRKK
jgi:hypothetical protein